MATPPHTHTTQHLQRTRQQLRRNCPASGDERAARQLTDDLLRARIAEEVQARWSKIVAEFNATLAAEQNNPDEIREISCRAPCENSAEQHAHEAVADDSASPRMLCQAVALSSLADTTVEPTPDVVIPNVNATPPLHSFIDEAHHNSNNKSCSIVDNTATDCTCTQQQTRTPAHDGQGRVEGNVPPALPTPRTVDMMCETCHIVWFHEEPNGVLKCVRCYDADEWTQCDDNADCEIAASIGPRRLPTQLLCTTTA